MTSVDRHLLRPLAHTPSSARLIVVGPRSISLTSYLLWTTDILVMCPTITTRTTVRRMITERLNFLAHCKQDRQHHQWRQQVFPKTHVQVQHLHPEQAPHLPDPVYLRHCSQPSSVGKHRSPCQTEACLARHHSSEVQLLPSSNLRGTPATWRAVTHPRVLL